MKMLMQCTHIQSLVIKALIKKLPLYAENEAVKVDPCFGVGDSSGADIVNMPRLILNQLRWLNVIENSIEIAVQLLEMSSVMGTEVMSMYFFYHDLVHFFQTMLDYNAVKLDKVKNDVNIMFMTFSLHLLDVSIKNSISITLCFLTPKCCC